MTKSHLFLMLLFLISLGFNSCKKDSGTDEHQDFKSKYFEISDATFVNEPMPDASNSSNAPSIQSIFGNHSVISGGSNLISVMTESSISYLLVGIEGITGYYKIPASSLDVTGGDTYLFYLLMSQSLDLQDFTILVSAIGSNNQVSQQSEVQVSQVEAGTGLLQISCTWDQLNDVDLHLIEPTDEEIYWDNSYSYNGGDLDVDSNADCDIDGINNENITYADDATVVNGEYIVNVDLFSNCNISSTTNYIVTAYFNGKLISPASGSNPYIGTFIPSDEDAGDAGSGRTAMKFNITSSMKAASINPLKLISFKFSGGLNSKPKSLSHKK